MAVAKRQVMFRAPCDLHDLAAELASANGEALSEVLTRALEAYVAGGLRKGASTLGPVAVPDITPGRDSTPDITLEPAITPVEVLAPPEVISPPAAPKAATRKTQRREKAVTVPAAPPAREVPELVAIAAGFRKRADCPHRTLKGSYCKLCRAQIY